VALIKVLSNGINYIGQQNICCIDANICSYLIWGRWFQIWP